MVCDFVTSDLFALAVVGAGVLHENSNVLFWSVSHDRWFRDNLDVAVSLWSRKQNNLKKKKKKKQEKINNKVPDEPLLDFICTVLPQES